MGFDDARYPRKGGRNQMKAFHCFLVGGWMGLVVVQAHAEGSEGVMDALTGGTVHLNLRVRYEHADQDGRESANAATIRARLGYETMPLSGVSALVEFEGTETLEKSDYNAAGVHGNSAKTVIADPESAEFNQAMLKYAGFDSVFKAGRQRIILDNARFVGNVGWRQNEQTFDAASLLNHSLGSLDVFYAYLGQVNRIFGSEADGAQRRLNSDSHLANVAFKVTTNLTLTAYGYFLDFESAAGLSSDTVGVRAKGAIAIGEDVHLGCLVEYAYQSDSGDNPVSYDADYLHLMAKGSIMGVTAGVGFELLGSDGTGVNDEGVDTFSSFQTPLATLHAFNGWADKFLTTPDEGLEDLYVYLGAKLPLSIHGKVVYHDFGSDEQSIDYGEEIDASLVKSINASTKLIAKYAHFNADERFMDTDKFSIEANFAF